MPLNTKQFILIGSGVATIGGGAVGTYYFLQEKTIRDRLTKSGEILAKEDKEYEDIFKALKDEEELIKLITTRETKITADSPVNEAGTALKNWCNQNLEKNLSDKDFEPLLEKAKKYCTKPPLTIGEKISKSSKKVVTDWGKKFNEIKTVGTEGKLLQDLSAIDKDIKGFTEAQQITKAKDALQKWCSQKEKTNLNDDQDNLIWTEFDVRCLEKRS